MCPVRCRKWQLFVSNRQALLKCDILATFSIGGFFKLWSYVSHCFIQSLLELFSSIRDHLPCVHNLGKTSRFSELPVYMFQERHHGSRNSPSPTGHCIPFLSVFSTILSFCPLNLKNDNYAAWILPSISLLYYLPFIVCDVKSVHE